MSPGFRTRAILGLAAAAAVLADAKGSARPAEAAVVVPLASIFASRERAPMMLVTSRCYSITRSRADSAVAAVRVEMVVEAAKVAQGD